MDWLNYMKCDSVILCKALVCVLSSHGKACQANVKLKGATLRCTSEALLVGILTGCV